MDKMSEDDFVGAEENLKVYKELSEDSKNHSQLLKDKKILLYIAVLLESEDSNILKLCLEILENFVDNSETHFNLLSTFGLHEALQNLAIRSRHSDEGISYRANEIIYILTSSSSRSNLRRTKLFAKRKNPMYLLEIKNLEAENRDKLEANLVKIKGVVSFVIDMELKRCTLRLCPQEAIEEVVQELRNCSFDAHDIAENGSDEKKYSKSGNKSYLDYLEEELSPGAKAVSTAMVNLARTGNDIIKNLINCWNDAFYW